MLQNFLSSLFNSHLFDFHEGWMYVLGVGVAGGMVLKAKSAELNEPPVNPVRAMIAGMGAADELSAGPGMSFRILSLFVAGQSNDASFAIDLAQFPDRDA